MVFQGRKEADNLSFLKKLLLIIIIALLIYTFFSYTNRDYFLKRELSKISIFPKADQLFSQSRQNDYTLFLKKVEGRNIFAPTYIKEPSSYSQTGRKKLTALMESLRLAGVISDVPPKVIIEDKKTQRTFYLKEGESFLENIKVEKIGKNSVILNCDGEKFELYL